MILKPRCKVGGTACSKDVSNVFRHFMNITLCPIQTHLSRMSNEIELFNLIRGTCSIQRLGIKCWYNRILWLCRSSHKWLFKDENKLKLCVLMHRSMNRCVLNMGPLFVLAARLAYTQNNHSEIVLIKTLLGH